MQPDIGITVQLRNKSLWYGKILFHRFALLGYLSLPDSPKQPTNHQFRHYKRKSRQQSVQNAIYDCNDSSHFLLQPTTPYSDQNIRIAQDSAFVIIRDSIAAGYLPYFGSGYSIPQTGNRGIIFSNTMQDLTRQTRGKGRRQSIFYQFSVVGKNDTYKLSIDIRHDGTCYLFINSLKRSPISYTGQIVEQE